MMAAGVPDLRDWVGREREEADVLDVARARGMAALLDRPPGKLAGGAPLPEGWHWLYFWPAVPRSRLGEDGHERRGDFLPPVPLPRRMWAGGDLRFLRPLRLGEEVVRRSAVRSVEEKEGRTGRLVFVTVGRTVEGPAGTAVEEEQRLVYREAHGSGEEDPPARTADAADAEAEWAESFLPDAVTLFRFSALTFNAHRIHYDRRWAVEREGYPGLLVHAPLTALLLLDAAARHGDRRPAAYRYRATRPLFEGEAMTLAGMATEDAGGAGRGGMRVWAADPAGRVAMEGAVAWRR